MMVRQSLFVLTATIALLPAACHEKTDPEVAKAVAQAEAAKQRAAAARAELEAARALTEKIKAETSAASERARADSAAAERRARVDSDRRDSVARRAVMFVSRNGSAILTEAYPLALGQLKFAGADLEGVAGEGDGYIATVRLKYRNLFRQAQYLDIAFDYDTQGGYRSWRYTAHSDVLAPKEITVGTLLELSK